MDERTFLVALIIQKPQNGITCFTQVCTSYCRFDCIMCVWHTHTDWETPMPHSRHTHTHIHVCSETFYFMWLPAHGPLSVCVCESASASVSCPLANIACPSRPTFVYARMRYAGHTSNVCGILGQLKSFKTLDTNRLAPLYVCVCVRVCLWVFVLMVTYHWQTSLCKLHSLYFWYSFSQSSHKKKRKVNTERKTHSESKRKLHNFFNKYLIQVLNFSSNNLNCQGLLLFRLFNELC